MRSSGSPRQRAAGADEVPAGAYDMAVSYGMVASSTDTAAVAGGMTVALSGARRARGALDPVAPPGSGSPGDMSPP